MKTVITITDRHGVAHRYQKGSIKRFSRLFSFNKWKHIGILVTYGKEKDVFGKIETFYNAGEYENGREALQALKAFIDGQL